MNGKFNANDTKAHTPTLVQIDAKAYGTATQTRSK